MRIFGRRTGDGPLATYAAVLDGAHLWWRVPGHDRLTLRPHGPGPEVRVDTDPFPLLALSADVYEVLVDGRPVRMESLPARAPARAPLAPDSLDRYDVALDGGHLRLARTSAEPAAVLDLIETRGERVHLRITPAAEVEAGVHLVLLDEDDRALDLLPVTAHDGHLEALIGADDLPAGYFGMLRPAVGTAECWVRIRRSRTDLVDPHQAVLLPELPGARFRWSPDSLLALRALDPARST